VRASEDKAFALYAVVLEEGGLKNVLKILSVTLSKLVNGQSGQNGVPVLDHVVSAASSGPSGPFWIQIGK